LFAALNMPYDNPNESFYWVDEQDKVLGAVSRIDAHSDPTKVHRSVVILITNNQNQMLFQKRSLNKDLFGGYWSVACGGHVIFGQEYHESAEREVYEELGIHPHLFYVTKALIKTEHEQEQCQVYLCRIEMTPNNLDKSEVAEIKWVPMEDIPLFVSQNQITPASVQVLKLLLYLK
jgi:isopentenyl-diphosphate Delta-isomerase